MNVTARVALFVTLCAVFLFCPVAFCPAAQAVPGSLYRGALERCYEHPVTGAIEDAGGKAGAATGQGMIEGCLSEKCMLEVTDDGQYFLTIRLGLIDYTSNREFKVQKWGAKKWSATKFAVTKKGKKDGETAYDYCIRVPSQKSIVRMTMFVKPIGREVVCYFYPTELRLGRQSGMNAKIVTEKSKKKDAGKKELETSEAPANRDVSSSGGESGTPEAGVSVGSAQGLTLSVADGKTEEREVTGLAGLGSLPLPLSGGSVWVFALAGALVLVLVVVLVWVGRHLRARKLSDPDDYSAAYAEAAAKDSEHRGGECL